MRPPDLPKLHRWPQATAVSITEVLLVVSILTFMLALLFPSLNDAREQARRIICANNLRQWSIALHNYREDYNDYLPTEGHSGNKSAITLPNTWYNVLPPYLRSPSYMEIEGVGLNIREFPEPNIWLCPSKNLTGQYKSDSGMNQFHYGMNQVLDGLGSAENPSPDAPDFPDLENVPLRAAQFLCHPNTVFMFDISLNSPAGTPRNIATRYQLGFSGQHLGEFHGDFANLLYLHGGVTNGKTDDFVTNRDFRHGKGDIVWNHARLYWGYKPKRR